MQRIWLLIILNVVFASTSHAQDLTPGEAYILIKHARPTVREADGWASDLLDVMKAQEIAATRENVCAAIAVIDQESNFNANPTVPGLGKLAEKALSEKLGHVPFLSGVAMNWLDNHPKGETSYLQRIRTARSERDLDLTYRAMVNDFGAASSLSLIVQSGLLNRMIEQRNNISTIGSMQVSTRFALSEARKHRYLPMTLSDDYAVRDELYTRRGGIYYGVKQLLGYSSGYNQKIYRFADFNAGRYSSRNAAFQHIISVLTKQKLARDGDLLLYDKNDQPLSALSATETALRKLAGTAGLALNDTQIRADLLLEKEDAFATTQTYMLVKNFYLLNTGKPAPFAEIPGIDLSSPKLSRKMTTASYAASVDKRYNKCMAAH